MASPYYNNGLGGAHTPGGYNAQLGGHGTPLTGGGGARFGAGGFGGMDGGGGGGGPNGGGPGGPPQPFPSLLFGSSPAVGGGGAGTMAAGGTHTSVSRPFTPSRACFHESSVGSIPVTANA